MPKVLVLFAHPRLEKSRTNKALLRRFPKHKDITFRDLYELYPDFNIDVRKEQALLTGHDIVVWHHPFYWYSAPPLLKQWIDLVLAFGWAYGPGGTALKGMSVFQVLTTGGPQQAYSSEGFHGSTMHEFLRPMQRTVTLCGMNWIPPFVVHGTHQLGDAELERSAEHYALLLTSFAEGRTTAEQVAEKAYLNDALPLRTI
ncbi:MAG TPA: NAD(P)H-dependent oxidoreductase [Flavobacteriales bacterium]|nr:NAD(P)H-dependent oxidoreductase [Flavobacteriales bacterium]